MCPNEETKTSKIKKLYRALSSVGRALPLQGRCHWFESSSAHHFAITSQKFKLTYF